MEGKANMKGMKGKTHICISTDSRYIGVSYRKTHNTLHTFCLSTGNRGINGTTNHKILSKM
jgi:hypothetical protein